MLSLHMLYSYIAYLCNLSFFCLLIQPARGTPSPLPAVSKTGKSVFALLSYIGIIHQTAPQLLSRCEIIVTVRFFSSINFQLYYNTFLGKITCESFTSAVHKFGRCLKFYPTFILFSCSFRT